MRNHSNQALQTRANAFPQIPPILVEDASLPSGLCQPLSSSPGQDVYSVSVLSKDVDDAHCASPPTFLSILEVPNQSKDPICLDAQLDCQNCFDFRVESEEGYSPCIIDMPGGNENSVSSQSYEEGVESFKSENLLSRLFWRQASFKSSGRDNQSLRKFTICQITNAEDLSVLPHSIPEKSLFCFQYCQVWDRWC
ncbi:uncharacterized protein LOC114714580 [Neltuma alba]|uniref:uncharacterized protein LOC114714580 n=1 Tax=Neltuma alba TaxID=207710 RepID=UPI0010A3FA7F|nr:uncharacterized protein LOC114714580 [Prosopis alba]